MKLKKLMTAKTVKGLILRIVILLVIPYLYLILCGIIFDKWLHLYSATSFIFWSLMVLWAIAIVISVFCILWYVKSKKNPEALEENPKKKETVKKNAVAGKGKESGKDKAEKKNPLKDFTAKLFAKKEEK